jgi:hypothetical protein
VGEAVLSCRFALLPHHQPLALLIVEHGLRDSDGFGSLFIPGVDGPKIMGARA